MLIYPTNPNFKINEDILQPYLQTEYQKLMFNTNEGIFEISSNKIYKFTSAPAIKLHRFNEELTFNIQSEDTSKKEVYYIPIHYKYDKVVVKKYKLTNNSILSLITENNRHFYFETSENEITNSIKDDMNTFLSELKLYS